MIWVLLIGLIYFSYALQLIYSDGSCFNTSSFISCNISNMVFSIEAVGNLPDYYNITYSYITPPRAPYILSVVSYPLNQSIVLGNPGSYIWSLQRESVLYIYDGNNLLLAIRAPKTSNLIEKIFSAPLTSIISNVTNIFNLYSVPLSIIFLLIISNLSGFPLIYKVAVISLGSFIFGLLYDSPVFYVLSLLGLLALGLLKFGGR